VSDCSSVAASRTPRGRDRGRGRGVRGRGGASGGGRRPKKTVEELDEEMTDYFHDNGGNNAAS
jgi:C-terminal duplication domain of Friend of PRMT1